ncbi:MAG TPA: hypothetical protein VM054_04825 [bacterium]|nr:hypothetical protein [bacterium]
MRKAFLRAACTATLYVFLVTSCATQYQRITGFVPTAKPGAAASSGTLRVEPLIVTGPTKYARDMGEIITQPPPHVENLEEYLTQATADYLGAGRLFGGVSAEGEADYVLTGNLSSFYLAVRTPTGWIILAIAGSAAFVVGIGAFGIYVIANIATCSEIGFPAWIWWTMGGGAAATAAGTIGGFASEYLAGEMVIDYALTDGGGRTVMSGTYTGYAEDADLEAYNRVVSAATNDCLGKLATDLAAALAP